MKKVILYVLTLLNISYAQWNLEWENKKPLPVGETMNSLQFIDSSTGWIICSQGYILKTLNEGLDWELINTNSNSYLRSISFIDSQNGWVVGNNNTILKTTNGGTTWIPQSSGQPINSALGYVKFFNENVGYIVGAYDSGKEGMTFTSYDDGKSWITKTNKESIWFDTVYYNEKKEMVAEIPDYTTNEKLILTSLDNGKSWTAKTDGRGKWLREIITNKQGEITAVSVDFRSVTPICLKTTDGGDTWIQKTAVSSGSTSFTDENTGYAVRNGVYKTNDGAESWFISYEDCCGPAYKLFFVNNDYGWVVGEDIYFGRRRTTNGGNTWEVLPDDNDGTQTAIFFLDENNGWISETHRHSMEPPFHIKTTDGGLTFNYFSGPTYLPLTSIYFTEVNNGWAIENNSKLLKTDSDGNFKEISFFTETSDIKSIYFIDSQNGWCVDSEEIYNIGTGGNIWKTTNGGQFWHNQQQSMSDIYLEIFFKDENFGWIKNYFDDYSLSTTTNGGNNWQSHQMNNDLYNFFFINNSAGWANEEGSIYHSTNSGDDWNQQYTAANNINSFFFSEQNIGWAVGQNGLILNTINGGIDWSTQTSNTSNDLNSIKFIGSIGFIVGSDGTILKTTDNGDNWFILNSGTTNCLLDLEIVDNNNVWASGCGGIILHSQNGGNDWNEEPSGTTTDLYDIGFKNINNGWATGKNDVLLKYVNASTSIVNTFYMSNKADDIMYYDGRTNSTVSRFGETSNKFRGIEQIYKNVSIPQNTQIVSATLEVKANATNSYKVIADLYYDNRSNPSTTMRYSDYSKNINFSSVTYQYSAPGFTAGNFYQIDITEIIQDKVNQSNWTEGDNLGIIIKGNPGLTAGSFREITRAENSLTDNKLIITYNSTLPKIAGNDVVEYIPENYGLFQNYPNPFNPTTTIEYQIPQEGIVTLNVYDVLGNEIKTLVNEPKSIGKYTIRFDAPELSSGIYIYRVKVNDFISTKKMILLK